MAKAKKTESTKAKKSADIRPMTDDQLTARVTEIAKEQLNLRFQKAAGQQANPKAASLLRKENARLKTEQSARRNTKSA